ncbi:MAG TPA: PKD domain-containing protein [Bacteroidales bacterium]|nr:PKD domain-containing protein [Bacteroidales bacterium]
MKKYALLIILVYCTCAFVVKAQVKLHADTSSGCGQLETTFSFQPALDNDTITSISWDFGNGSTTSGPLNPSVVYTTPGVYDVSVTINRVQVIEAPGLISVYPLPATDFFYADTLDAGNFAFIFNAPDPDPDTLSYTYYWNFNNGMPDTGKHVFHDFGSAGNYQVTLRVEDSYGCADSVSQSIQVNDLMALPNVFTPNGDGINDYFRIRTNGIYSYSFLVYTRSGVLIYRSESPYINWDGRSFSGQEMHNGIYYYIVSQIDGDNRLHAKGFVHLLR